MLIEKIGTPAMLEQTAEECVELAHACLKMARYERGENKSYTALSDVHKNLSEEIADVLICLGELQDGNVVSPESVDSNIIYKLDRMKKRMEEM